MKRIVYSIYNGCVEQTAISTNKYKLSQFIKYKDNLKETQRAYAEKCNAEYVLHETDITNYDSIQFEKIFLLEKYAEEYDEILYLDFDIVPHIFKDIFQSVDLTKISMHPLKRELTKKEIAWEIRNKNNKDHLHLFDQHSVFCKTAAKNSMLLLDGISGHNKLYNTGVIIGDSQSIKKLEFSRHLEEMKIMLNEAQTDCMFPEEISKYFFHNNEVFISYLLERYNVPHNDLEIQWNFILDPLYPNVNEAAYFIHHVNKEFELSFD